MKKKDEQPKPAGLRPQTITRTLKYMFKEDELSAMNKELAFEVKNLGEIQEEKKSVMSGFTARIKTAESRTQLLANNLSSGFTYKAIDCTVTYNSPTSAMKQIKRNDNDEIIGTVKMSYAELQEGLELKDVPDANAEPD